MRTLLLLALLAGCAEIDPLTRPGTWHPLGANDLNLRAMLANPQDLQRGVPLADADGMVVAAAAHRYRTGKVRTLPESGLAKIVPVASGAVAAAPGAE